MRWKQGSEVLQAFGHEYLAWCRVRTLAAGTRGVEEVVYTIPAHEAYDPVIFPVGSWTVGRPVKRKDPYKAPYFIPTNAWARVQVWEVRDGKYLAPTSRWVADMAYGLHFSTSLTTLGCLRIGHRWDLLELVKSVEGALDAGHEVVLEVEP